MSSVIMQQEVQLCKEAKMKYFFYLFRKCQSHTFDKVFLFQSLFSIPMLQKKSTTDIMSSVNIAHKGIICQSMRFILFFSLLIILL